MSGHDFDVPVNCTASVAARAVPGSCGLAGVCKECGDAGAQRARPGRALPPSMVEPRRVVGGWRESAMVRWIQPADPYRRRKARSIDPASAATPVKCCQASRPWYRKSLKPDRTAMPRPAQARRKSVCSGV